MFGLVIGEAFVLVPTGVVASSKDLAFEAVASGPRWKEVRLFDAEALCDPLYREVGG